MRVAVLWATLTGYINGALKELAAIPGTEIFVADNIGPSKQAPFAESLFAWIPATQRFTHDGNPDAAELLRRLEAFQPDVLFVASWSTPAYNAACKRFAGRAVRVCGVDNQWYGTPKQRLGALTAPIFVRRLFDCMMVAGERQRVFAEKMGFDRDHILQGLYCPDYAAFSAVRLGADKARPKGFLFAARLVPDKGLDLLVEAYRRYRALCAAAGTGPWPLAVIGGGPLQALVQGQDGITAHGFVQPDAVPALFAAAGCFVLPSVHEHWGVAVQEATVAGLPVICSQECGAGVHYVVDGYNGAVVKTGSVESLLAALVRIASSDEEELRRMSLGSLALSEQITPQRWARYFLQKTELLSAPRG